MNFVELTEKTADPIGTAVLACEQELGTNLRTETVRVKDQWVHGAGRALRGARRQAHPADYRSRIKGGMPRLRLTWTAHCLAPGPCGARCCPRLATSSSAECVSDEGAPRLSHASVATLGLASAASLRTWAQTALGFPRRGTWGCQDKWMLSSPSRALPRWFHQPTPMQRTLHQQPEPVVPSPTRQDLPQQRSVPFSSFSSLNFGFAN